MELIKNERTCFYFHAKIEKGSRSVTKTHELKIFRVSKPKSSTHSLLVTSEIHRKNHARKKSVDETDHFVTILLRETEKSKQQQREFRNKFTREEQPWLRKKLKKQLRKLQRKLQKKLLKRKRSS